MTSTVHDTGAETSSPASWRRSLSPRNISVVYLGIILFAFFAIRIPNTFLTTTTLQTTLADLTVTALVALAVLVPLAAGAFDLSVVWSLGLSATVAAKLMTTGTSPFLACLAGLACGLIIGCVNGFLIARVGMNSFIATLGTGSLISAAVFVIGDNQPIFGIPTGYSKIGFEAAFGIPWIVYFLIVVFVLAWYVLEYTPVGRYLYATGANQDAARLAGLPTQAYIWYSLVVSGLIGASAGLIAIARINGSTPDLPNSYLLPAFAAVFLGATQLKEGRPNIWGTAIALFVLAMATKGFALIGIQIWIQQVFNGLALIIAVGVSIQAEKPPRVRKSRRHQDLEKPPAKLPEMSGTQTKARA
jgi:ribose transport system permease protein